MRSFFGLLGVVLALVVVVMVGRYGYKTTDREFDAWTTAVLFGGIAMFSLGAHTFALRLWRDSSRIVGAFVGAAAVITLVINFSNTLSALAGRSDAAIQARVEKNRAIRAVEDEIKRLSALRTAMPAFVTTDAAAVSAAKSAVEAATTSKERECDAGNKRQRGDQCRLREQDEAVAMKAWRDAASAKAATDRADSLEAELAVQRKRQHDLGAVVAINPAGGALARLFRLQDEEAGYASIAQQLAIVLAAELVIICCLIGWEATGRENAVPTSSVEPRPPITPLETSPSLQRAVNAEKPKLVASNDRPIGSVEGILATQITFAAGKRVEVAEAGRRYKLICKLEGKRSAREDEFLAGLRRYCTRAGIELRQGRGRLDLIEAALVALPHEAEKGA